MIYFLTLFTTLCVQFCSVDLPVKIVPNFMPSDAISMGFDYMSRTGGIWSYYSDVQLDEDGIFITSYDYGNYFQIKYYVPVNPYVSNVNSNYSLSSFSVLNNDFISGSITLNGYSCYVYYYYKGNTSSNFGAQEWHNYNNETFDFYYPVGYAWAVFAYTTSPLYYNDEIVILPELYIEPPSEELGSLGSLTVTGHSNGGIPSEELNNFSWSNISPLFALTGHSVGVSQNQSTPDFSSPVQNLLGQIIDNSNKIIQNIKSVGDYLGAIISNIREGFSAVFNAVSQFNNNVISFFDYIKEPLDQDLIMDHVDDMSFMQLADSISSAGSHVSSSFNNVSNNQTLVFPIDLRNTIFSNAGIMYLDLSFLDDTKSTWQPLLIAFLYITLTFNIIMSLPSIIQGQSREGGKSD